MEFNLQSFINNAIALYNSSGKLLSEGDLKVVENNIDISKIESDPVLSSLYLKSKKYYRTIKEKKQEQEEDKLLSDAIQYSQKQQIKEKESEIQKKNEELKKAVADVEEKLKKQLQQNSELLKAEGMTRISFVAIWGVIGICVFPGLILLLQVCFEFYLTTKSGESYDVDQKSWDVLENFGIYALGTLSGLLLGFFGAKSVKGSEDRTGINTLFK